MDLILPASPPGGLDIDYVGDFSCPWSFLGTRRLAVALRALGGVPVRALRWHTLPRPPATSSSPWRDHLAARLPRGVAVEFAESSLADAGRDLGITFDFARVRGVPDTTAAHRLVALAAREDRHGPLVDRIFSAYFEHGRDIGSLDELIAIGREAGVSDSALETLRDPAVAHEEVVADEQRLRGLGVSAVPNLLFNRRVLVPGAADRDVYVQALDQALFPQLTAEGPRPTLH
jgi:predicted DsbA family dithiol-disulfide isomerase